MTAPFDIARLIAPQLPYLRRFARALTGGQAPGDAAAAATLQRIIDDPSCFRETDQVRAELYRQFYEVWKNSGSRIVTGSEDANALAAQCQHRLHSLTTEDRIAVLLHGLEGLSIQDIGQIMGVAFDEAERLIASGRTALFSQIGGRILIIEDEPLIAMGIEETVLGLGHEVTGIVDTHAKAVAAATDNGPNLVLADIRLADGSSGIEAVNDILGFSRIPVVFITAFPELLLTGERPEPTFLISKPFMKPELETAVGQALFFGSSVAPKFV